MVKISSYGDGKNWFRGNMIGKGGSGRVFLATLKKPTRRINRFLPLTMAVKSAEFSDSSALQKEMMVLKRLEGCPHIRTCYCDEITTSADQEGGGTESMVYNLLLEYASGGTLDDLINMSAGSGLPEQDVRVYTRSILLGISYTHAYGYVHRDLEPKNILLFPSTDYNNSTTSSGYMAKIGDFGYAKKVDFIKRRTMMDPYLRGKIKYMSPEAVVNKVQDQPSDIWALGCIVLEMLTGKSIWEGRTDSQIKNVLHSIGTGKRLLPLMVNVNEKGISREARNFLSCCFVSSAEERPTAEKLLCHPFVAGMLVDRVSQGNNRVMHTSNIHRSESTSLSHFVLAGA